MSKLIMLTCCVALLVLAFAMDSPIVWIAFVGYFLLVLEQL